MVQQLLMLGAVSWSAAITACEKGTHWDKALELPQAMAHSLLTPDVVSHNVTIGSCDTGT